MKKQFKLNMLVCYIFNNALTIVHGSARYGTQSRAFFFFFFFFFFSKLPSK
jgi:hypothetical protein